MCSYDISNRYSALDALNHPFITRKLNSEIPMTMQDEITNMEIKEALCNVRFIR